MVGTSGTISDRFSLVIASARTRPALMCGVTGGIAWQPNGTWLPTTAAIDGPPPA